MKRLSALLLLLVLTACSPASARAPSSGFNLVTRAPDATATPTPFQPSNVTPAPLQPTATLMATPLPTLTLSPVPVTPTLTSTFTPAPTRPAQTALPPANRPQYTIYASLDYTAHSLSVDQTIQYTNQTGQNLSDLVLAVEPNLWTGSFVLTSLKLDGVETAYTLDSHRLQVNLSQTLPPGRTVKVSLQYYLYLPPKTFEKTFGYVGYQLNLTDWYPFIVPYIAGQGWVLHDPWAFGEHLVYDSSDFDIYLQLTDPSLDLTIAASAPGEDDGDWTHYHLNGARTFALSASPSLQMVESAVGSVTIRSYYYAGNEDAGQAMLWAATQAVSIYEAKFAPYPYDSLSVVEVEVPDGQEFDGLVFLSSEFYDNYPGKSRSNLVTIGVHEIAHEWWFGLVGNDQALEPWLDETLATYSEHIFYEYNYPGSESWWWNFRVDYFGPSGWVDTSIYNGGTFRTYTNAAYLNGAHFIDDLRVRIGDEDFFAFIKDYAATYSRGRATSYDFFNLLRQHTDTDFSDLEQAYFQQAY
jgi:hypothetical protein